MVDPLKVRGQVQIKAINYICSDSFSRKIFSVHFRAINHQIVDKKNLTEFAF